MGLGLRIDSRDSVPIWKQIEDSLRRMVAAGTLAPGAAVPSVRDLAHDLGVNPATVSKAPALLPPVSAASGRVI